MSSYNPKYTLFGMAARYGVLHLLWEFAELWGLFSGALLFIAEFLAYQRWRYRRKMAQFNAKQNIKGNMVVGLARYQNGGSGGK